MWIAGGVLTITVLIAILILYMPEINNLLYQTGEITNDHATETTPISGSTSSTDTASSGEVQNPQGKTIIVTNSSNQARGSLRQAIVDSQPGDTILFDPGVFPPNEPVTIYITEPLRIITESIMIDASNAGVILDGSSLPHGSFGLIINSDHNIIMGLKITNMQTVGIYMEGGSYNTIGGDRAVGSGPYGQGNMLVNNRGAGISFLPDCGGNKIIGNLIGTDESGTTHLGNDLAGIVFEGAQFEGHVPEYSSAVSTIGPGNVIAFNGEEEKAGANTHIGGISIASVKARVEITGNTIFDNAGKGIEYLDLSDAADVDQLAPPTILYFELGSGLAAGHTCNDCRVEIFSTDAQDAKIYEGEVTADEFGNFIFRKDGVLSGPFLTATTRFAGKSTSEISLPTPAISNIQIALNALQSQTPYYQTSFDTWDNVRRQQNVRLENGKLIAVSENDENITSFENSFSFGKFAVEFELRILDATGQGHCVFATNGVDDDGYPITMAPLFRIGTGELGVEELNSQFNYNIADTYRIRLLFLGTRTAVFINDQITYTSPLLFGSVKKYTTQSFQSTFTITCEFDNYKLWDLTEVVFNP